MRVVQQGFTIIELMVTLAVTGVVLFYAVPSFNVQIKNGRLTSNVNQLVAAMHLGRSEASKRRVPVVICTSTSALNEGSESCDTSASWNEGWIAFGDANDNGSYDAANEDLLQAQGAQGNRLSVSATNEISESITYLPNGFARLALDNEARRFIVYCIEDEDDEFSRVLALSNSGRPQVVDRANAPDAPSCATSGS